MTLKLGVLGQAQTIVTALNTAKAMGSDVEPFLAKAQSRKLGLK